MEIGSLNTQFGNLSGYTPWESWTGLYKWSHRWRCMWLVLSRQLHPTPELQIFGLVMLRLRAPSPRVPRSAIGSRVNPVNPPTPTPNLPGSMATPTNLLRLCLRPTRRLPSLRAISAAQQQQQAQQRLLPLPLPLQRRLSTTPCRRDDAENDAAENDAEEQEIERIYTNPGQYLRDVIRDEKTSEQQRQVAMQLLDDWNKMPANTARNFDELSQELHELMRPLREPAKVGNPARLFWNEDEDDPDLITDEVGEDDFEEDDIMAAAHPKLEEHREFREYARIAVWEMPLLASKRHPTPRLVERGRV